MNEKFKGRTSEPEQKSEENWEFDFTPYTPILMLTIIVVCAALFGWASYNANAMNILKDVAAHIFVTIVLWETSRRLLQRQNPPATTSEILT